MTSHQEHKPTRHFWEQVGRRQPPRIAILEETPIKGIVIYRATCTCGWIDKHFAGTSKKFAQERGELHLVAHH